MKKCEEESALDGQQCLLRPDHSGGHRFPPPLIAVTASEDRCEYHAPGGPRCGKTSGHLGPHTQPLITASPQPREDDEFAWPPRPPMTNRMAYWPTPSVWPGHAQDRALRTSTEMVAIEQRFHTDPVYRARWETYRLAGRIEGADPWTVDEVIKVADAEIAHVTALLRAKLTEISEAVKVYDGEVPEHPIMEELIEILDRSL